MLAVIGIGFVCYRVLAPFLAAIAWAIVFAVAFQKPWSFLERRMPRYRGFAAALMTLAVAVGVLAPVGLLVGMLANQVAGEATRVTTSLNAQSVRSFADFVALPKVAHLLDDARIRSGISSEDFQKLAAGVATRVSSAAGALSGELVLGLFDSLVTVLLAIFLLFFLFRDGQRMAAATIELLPTNALAPHGPTLRRQSWQVLRLDAADDENKGSPVMKPEHCRLVASVGFVAFLTLIPRPAGAAAVAPSLGQAATYAVLGTNPIPTVGTVTCTTSTINGDVGSTFSSVTNTGCTINGAVIAPVPGGVVTDFNNAYAALDSANPVCAGVIPTTSATLAPGVYCSAAGSTLGAGVIFTLNGTASDVWVFKIGTSGTGGLTGNSFQVVMGGAALPCNVYWRTAQAATLTDSSFVGTILAGSAITLTRGSYLGRALAGTDVTVTSEAPLTFAGCSAATVAIPALSVRTMLMLVVILALLGVAAIRKFSP